MKVTEALSLIDYNAWATNHVLDAAARIRPEQFTAASGPHGVSLQSTLVHVLNAERLWRTCLETGISPPKLRAETAPTPDALRRLWQEEAAAMRGYLAMLDDEALEEAVQFRRLSGELSDPIRRWHVVVQMVMHGAQHRSEAAALLTGYGESPGDLDFLFFILRLR